MSKSRRTGTRGPVRSKKKKRAAHPVGRAVGRLVLILLETVLLIAMALYAVMFILAKGPSTTARDRFVMSLHESSALKWVPSLVLSEEEIAGIESARATNIEYQETDTSLITINTPQTADPASGPEADPWGLIDEDGDGIVINRVRGEGYNGYMMVVYDASRVIMGCVPASFERQGYTLADMVKQFDAVAGINVTLGLPIIRASVDHGTGFGHAGDGHANELSLINAIDYAVRMASAK